MLGAGLGAGCGFGRCLVARRVTSGPQDATQSAVDLVIDARVLIDRQIVQAVEPGRHLVDLMISGVRSF
jgi:hypothetical protein